MTAGNSTPLTDGASAVLLALGGLGRRARAASRWPTCVDHETAAVDFVHGNEGLLMAPAYAVPRMLARNGLTLQDFDFYEIHEAFASQVLATLKAWDDPVFCKERLGLDSRARRDRPVEAQRQRLVAGRGPPLRRDRRADPQRRREAARPEGLGPRADLHLRRRRPGRRPRSSSADCAVPCDHPRWFDPRPFSRSDEQCEVVTCSPFSRGPWPKPT